MNFGKLRQMVINAELPNDAPVLILEGSRIFELGGISIPTDQIPIPFVLSTKLKSYLITWLGGKTEIIKGVDLVDALNQSGYGAGAVRALDGYKEFEPPSVNTTGSGVQVGDYLGEGADPDYTKVRGH